MYYLIHQSNDLTEVSGYAFESVTHALNSAAKRIGLACVAAVATVRVPNSPSPGFPCWVAKPADGSTGLCREGHMTLIAEESDVMPIASRLCRRNGGDAVVVIDKSVPAP